MCLTAIYNIVRKLKFVNIKITKFDNWTVHKLKFSIFLLKTEKLIFYQVGWLKVGKLPIKKYADLYLR